MDLINEIEMRRAQKYLERVQRGDVKGAEPFHTITILVGSASEKALIEASKILTEDRIAQLKAVGNHSQKTSCGRHLRLISS